MTHVAVGGGAAAAGVVGGGAAFDPPSPAVPSAAGAGGAAAEPAARPSIEPDCLSIPAVPSGVGEARGGEARCGVARCGVPSPVPRGVPEKPDAGACSSPPSAQPPQTGKWARFVGRGQSHHGRAVVALLLDTERRRDHLTHLPSRTASDPTQR